MKALKRKALTIILLCINIRLNPEYGYLFWINFLIDFCDYYIDTK